MRYTLKCHRDSPSVAATHVEVSIVRPDAGSLLLSFAVAGKIGDLLMPAVTAPARIDDLWHHTCFEAFIRATPHGGYYEFNFSPSTQWAAYRFDGYRSGMRVAAEIGAPKIAVESTSECYTLQAALDLGELSPASRWRLGLSAVIEETSGRKSYWALAHSSGKPDFHHPDCFAGELSPA
jgi:hypothetical protein